MNWSNEIEPMESENKWIMISAQEFLPNNIYAFAIRLPYFHKLNIFLCVSCAHNSMQFLILGEGKSKNITMLTNVFNLIPLAFS